jgi:hypothetical protein
MALVGTHVDILTQLTDITVASPDRAIALFIEL